MQTEYLEVYYCNDFKGKHDDIQIQRLYNYQIAKLYSLFKLCNSKVHKLT